jgi:hypothetical protein
MVEEHLLESSTSPLKNLKKSPTLELETKKDPKKKKLKKKKKKKLKMMEVKMMLLFLPMITSLN